MSNHNFDEAAEREAFDEWYRRTGFFIEHDSGVDLGRDAWLAAKRQAMESQLRKEPAKYLIWNGGYVGNAMVWWRPEGRGYTVDIDDAGRFDESKARSIIRYGDHTAFPEDYILDGSRGRVKRIVDSQCVNREMALK